MLGLRLGFDLGIRGRIGVRQIVWINELEKWLGIGYGDRTDESGSNVVSTHPLKCLPLIVWVPQ